MCGNREAKKREIAVLRVKTIFIKEIGMFLNFHLLFSNPLGYSSIEKILLNMSEFPPCPKCKSLYVYALDDQLACPECGYEWSVKEMDATELSDEKERVLDALGNELNNGDTVVVIKDLPVKGMPKAIKAGTKVKNIRLKGGDHNIDCKIDGFGAMALKSEFVRKG